MRPAIDRSHHALFRPGPTFLFFDVYNRRYRPSNSSNMGHVQPKCLEWGQHFESSGKIGTPPDMAEPKMLLDLYLKWYDSTDETEREKIWHEMLKVHADQVYTIGVVNTTFQPIVARSNLKNIPEKGPF